MGLENVRLALCAADVGTKAGDAMSFTIEGEIQEITTKYGKRFIIPLRSDTLGDVDYFARLRDVQVIIRKYGMKLKDYLGKVVRLELQPYEFEREGIRKEGLRLAMKA